MNEHFGGPARLPFDLRHRRWPVRYSLSNNATPEQRAVKCEQLSQNIEYAIRLIIQSGVLITTINPKDKRVALRFEEAINIFSLSVLVFIKEFNRDLDLEIFSQDFEDIPGSNYPDPHLVEHIIEAFANTDLRNPSNHQINNTTLGWTESFSKGFFDLYQRCDKILDQYADRDDNLVSLVDEIQRRARIMSSILETLIMHSQTETTQETIIEQHIDSLRFFFLAILKSHRVIRQFKH